MAVSRLETLLVMTPIVAGLAFIGYAVQSTYRDYQTRNAPAWAAGFANVDDMEDAKKAGFATSALWQIETDRRASAHTAEKAKADANAAQAKAVEDRRKNESNEKFQIAVRGAIALRESMKNPDSFKLERVVRMSDGSLCYTYRAANSFNAIIPGQAALSPTKGIKGSEAFPMSWSERCKGLFGEAVENVAYALTYYPRR
jgi:hypothetical protein